MKELISCIKNLPNHFITAVQNIWRNGVMSVSSVFAVTITLVIIAVIGALAVNIQSITTNIESDVRIFVKLDRTLDEVHEQQVGQSIKALSGVSDVEYSSKDDQLTLYIENYGSDASIFEDYRKDNPLGSAYYVDVKDTSTISNIAEQIGTIEGVKDVEYGGDSTRNMLSTLEMIRTGGYIFIAGLTIIALFMIANTIKITITSRQMEISIMRMVGASNWYIRIPFMLEGMLIGILGSIVPIIILVYGYNTLYSATNGMLVSSMLVLQAPNVFLWQFSGFLVLLGSGVGILGSFVSIRRFLKF